jgi:transposase
MAKASAIRKTGKRSFRTSSNRHFTPTYSSWLNQVELWFGRIEREVVARGVFTSVNDLARKLMRYIRHHNQHAAPIKCTYRDCSHRIISTSDSAVTGH